MVSSLPSNGWSCATLEEGVSRAAEAAGLSLKTKDYLQARFGKHGFQFLYILFHVGFQDSFRKKYTLEFLYKNSKVYFS